MSSVALKKTILHSAHLKLNAKLVDFGGWEMPVNYGSQIEEHHATRNACGIFDVSHMAAVDVTGKDAFSFLQKVVANDVAKLRSNGQALYGCLLNADGGVIDDLIVYRLEPGYRIVINAGTAEKDLIWLRKNSLEFSDVVLTPRRADLAGAAQAFGMIAIQGPLAKEVLSRAIPETKDATEALKPFHCTSLTLAFGELMVARTGYTGEDGFEILLPENKAEEIWFALIEQGAKPAGLGARDTLRLEAGMNLYGQDMSETVSPLDAGLTWTVDLSSKRDFIGRNALQTNPQKFDFVGLLMLDKGILRSHQIVQTSLGDGEITSGTFSPTLEQSIALARVPKGVEIGTIVNVIIRDKLLQARVVKPCFVRKGKKLI